MAIYVTYLYGEVGELLKRGLVFCIKSLALVEVLIFGVGFIKVRFGILYNPLKHLRWIFLRKWFSAVSR